jgi:hypothetical protein
MRKLKALGVNGVRTRYNRAQRQRIAQQCFKLFRGGKVETIAEAAKLLNTKPQIVSGILKQHNIRDIVSGVLLAEPQDLNSKLTEENAQQRSNGSGKTKRENRVVDEVMSNALKVAMRFNRGEAHEKHQLHSEAAEILHREHFHFFFREWFRAVWISFVFQCMNVTPNENIPLQLGELETKGRQEL